MDFDWKRFGPLQFCCTAALVTLVGLILIGIGGGANGFYWVALIANVVLVLFALLFVAYPRKDGSWRGIGDAPKR